MFARKMRNLFNPQNFYEVQQPILKVTFITGMTPFTIVREEPNVAGLRCTAFGYLNSTVHIVFFCVCYVMALIQKESVTRYFFQTEISTLGDILQVMTGLVALVLTFFYTIFQRNKLIHAFNLLANTDEQFQNIGFEINYKSTLLYNYFIITVQILILGINCGISIGVTQFSTIHPSFTAWVSFFLPFIMITLVICLFVCLVQQARYRFYMLNRILATLRHASLEKKILSQDDKPTTVQVMKIQKPLGISAKYSNSNRYLLDVINKIARIQDELCEACCFVEEYFKIQMLAIVTISFLIVVFDSYYILEMLFTQTYVHTVFSKIQFVMYFLCQAIVQVVGVFKIVFFSSLAKKENDKIAVNVHKLINVNNYDDDVVKQLSNLSLQLTHRKVSFTAYGLFNLDFTLLFTLTGAATTYLVILVQFTINQNELCGPKLINSTIASLAKNASLFQND
ncbi:putative gustatory receptor 28b isoform X1 [Wyeomyia smithii]|uniref:putative gustatory receptor 28b isoform X1 n=1 Tax=Wyeomyia smithii TaxID=174621 RepID=UPI0024681531|nr:putative gustatory receptor 28b isoform X1 [Wyeomyia smithii]